MKTIFSIWIKPKKTFEFIATQDEEKNDKIINWLFFIISMSVGFSNVDDINKLLDGNYFIGLIIAMLVSGLMGLFLLKHIFSLIFWASGKIFQGKGTKKEIQLVIAYSLVPNLVLLLIGLILIIPAIILDNYGLISYQHPITHFILWIFTLRIMIFGLAYFNKYSYGYSILTIFIPLAIVQGLLLGIKYLLM
ncbi:MAG: hypothetical protein GXO79_10450 [Chlorobi bacterium]|nr:hypothetical protein [Chlorobiota bacterium]